MKAYIEYCLRSYNNIFKSPACVLQHLFAVLGNGCDLDNKGYLPGNYRSTEVYPFGEPTELRSIYSWSKNEEFQPFRDVAGCRDVGFKESAKYFIDCIKATPDTVKNIKEWKENIHIVEDVLLNTPTIADEYLDVQSGYKTFLTKLPNATVTDNHGGLSENTPKSVTKGWYFDAQWSDCPEFVEKEVQAMWRSRGLGNDNYIYKATQDNELFSEYPNVYYWLKHSGVSEGEKVIIHWWW